MPHRRQILAAWILTLVVVCSANGRGTAPTSAAEFNPEKLAAVPVRMQQFVDEKQISGAVTVVGNEKGIARIDAVGSFAIAGDRPMSKDSLFRIASMTKPITALAVMMLVDEGKLAVTDPVEKHLPEFRGQMQITGRADGSLTLRKPSRPITVRDLLTHTSGLPGGYPEGLSDLYIRRHLTLKEAVLISSQRPLEFEPGSKWSYCNAGIDTLGRIVEVLSERSFEEFLGERLFQPLGMKDTTFYPSDEQLSRATPVYDRRDGQLVLSQNAVIGLPPKPRHPIPAGGLFSTANDLATLYQMLLGKGEMNGKRFVSENSLAEMTKLQTGDLTCGFVDGMGFGYGFAVVREPRGVTGMLSPGTYGHGGAFGTQGWIDPSRGAFVILLIQRIGLPNGDASDMRMALQQITFEAINK